MKLEILWVYSFEQKWNNFYEGLNFVQKHMPALYVKHFLSFVYSFKLGKIMRIRNKVCLETFNN